MSFDDYVGEDVRGRCVHTGYENIAVPLPALDYDSKTTYKWRLLAKMGIASYWLPEVSVVLHRFNWVPEIQKSVTKVTGQAWESAHGYGLVVDQAHAFACSLLYQEFGGDQLDYAFIHLFGRGLNDLGNAVRRSVQAYEAVKKRGAKVLNEQVLAGGIRVQGSGGADVEE